MTNDGKSSSHGRRKDGVGCGLARRKVRCLGTRAALGAAAGDSGSGRATVDICKDGRVRDHRCCRLSARGGELELAGPPDALRALGGLLRDRVEPLEVVVTGGTVAQKLTSGPLLITLRNGPMLHVSGGHEFLDIFWHALDGVADQADSAEDRRVNRHQHIEYFPGDEYRSPDSLPLAVVGDWPEQSATT